MKLALSFALLALASGCQVCGKSSCDDGVRVRAEHAGQGELSPGRYRIAIETDGQPRSCELVIGEQDACESGGVLTVQATPTSLELQIAATPARLGVEITRDDTPLAARDFDLQYEPRYVNNGGGDCATECAHAGEQTLELTTP